MCAIGARARPRMNTVNINLLESMEPVKCQGKKETEVEDKWQTSWMLVNTVTGKMVVLGLPVYQLNEFFFSGKKMLHYC